MAIKNVFKIILCFVSLGSSASYAQSYKDFNGVSYPDGPNCFNTSLRVLSIAKTVRYIHDSEFEIILKNQCRLVTNDTELAARRKLLLGVVSYVTKIKYQPIHIQHAFTLLEDGRTISKLGPQSKDSTYIKTLEFELNESHIDEGCVLFNQIRKGTIGELLNQIEDLGACKKYLQFYDCGPSKERVFRKDIQPLYLVQKKIELEVENCLTNASGCDLSSLEMGIRNLEDRILQAKHKIETNEGYIGNKNYDDIRELEIRSESIGIQLKLLKGEPII